jgi:peptidoglycan/xylan/chitin deacetylase (PgdA/CDA1 family)
MRSDTGRTAGPPAGRLLAGRLLAGLPAVVLVAAIAACTQPGASPAPVATPAAEATTAPQPSTFVPTRPFAPTPPPTPAFEVHTVREGDTLIAIAEELETTPESLAYWNRARYPSLDPDSPDYRPDRIEVGWRLVYLPGQVVDPEDLPPAASPPGATDAPIVGPFPTLPADGSAALVERGPNGLDGVALTFDYRGGAGAVDGSGPEAVVQWLEVNGVPATVFVAPSAADPGDAAGRAVLRRLAGSTGLATGLLGGPGGAPLTDAGLRDGDAAIAAALGTSTAPLVRPAAGSATRRELRAAGTAGWPWAIAWDVDPDDGRAPEDGGPIAVDIVARVVSRAEGGSIVRLQLDGPRTLEALPDLVDALAAAGLRVVPLDEVLGR